MLIHRSRNSRGSGYRLATPALLTILTFFMSLVPSGTAAAQITVPGQPVPVGQCDGGDPPPQCLPIFTSGYPRAIFFRTPENASRVQGYIDWEATFGRLDGIITKTVEEELANLAPNAVEYMATFAAVRDDQLVMLHFNGNAMDPQWQRIPGVFQHEEFSAGHWLYFPGTSLTADVAAGNDAEWISVGDVSLFRDDIGLGNAGKKDDIVLVQVADGQKQWEQAEHMTLEEIDVPGGRLRVRRGHFSSAEPLSFTAGEAYVAPHVPEGPWGRVDNNLLWQYNFSTACPRDTLERNAGEVLAQVLGDFLNPAVGASGPDGRDYHGVQLDISPWWKDRQIEGRIADVNNDGLPDGGILADRNEYGRGVYDFLAELRRVLGDDRLIVADGGASDSQRAVGVLNGMEAEGFSGFNDPFLGNWSTAVNRMTYWRDHAGASPGLTYVVHKDTVLDHPPENVSRLVLAASQALGLPVTSLVEPGPDRGHTAGIWDELRKGDEELYHWLGLPRTTSRQPGGATQRLARTTPDLLQGAGQRLDASFVNAWSSSDAQIELIGNELRFTALGPCTGSRVHTCMTVRYSGLELPTGDLTVFFELRADPLVGFPSDVPREVTVRAMGQHTQAPTTQHLGTFAGSAYFLSSFYFRNAGPATVDLELEIEGGEALFLRGFTAHNAADALARDFHRGMVIANPSRSSLGFDLASLSPGRDYRRLRASQLQDAQHNHGGSQGRVGSLAALDGLFLVHDREPVSDFAATPTGADGPINVTFTDLSTDVTKDQFWDFGDGSPVLKCAPSCNPMHLYTERGYYTVKLVSRNDFGRQALRREGHIVIGDTTSFVARDGFSSIQGQNHWFYFGWNGDYRPLVFQDGSWRWDPESENPLTKIFSGHEHPHNAESARAWRSPKHGTVQVRGRVRKGNVGGDGVTASIYLDDQRIEGPWLIAGTDDTIGHSFAFDRPIRQGQTLYFRVHMNGDPLFDATVWEGLTVDLTALDLPQVDFSVFQPPGENPVRAVFTDQTTCLPGPGSCDDPSSETWPVRWAWDLDGDGRTETWAKQTAWIYSEPGGHDVKLRVENGAGWAELLHPDAVVIDPPASRIWRASADFSQTQGQDQWHYLEWNVATGTYRPLVWSSDHWQGSALWTRIYSSYEHPDSFPVARAWEAPWAGTLRIEGQVRLTNPQGCGDGVRAWLFHGSRVIGGPYNLDGGDTTGVPMDIMQAVEQGDRIYFRTHRVGTVSCDATSWSPTLTLTVP